MAGEYYSGDKDTDAEVYHTDRNCPRGESIRNKVNGKGRPGERRRVCKECAK